MKRPIVLYILIAAAIAALTWKVKTMYTRAEFKKKMAAELGKANLQGFSPLLLMALASYESGDGNGNVAQQTNNVFSLTAGKYWKGPVYKASTGYVFRKYASWKDSAEDFVKLLMGWPSNYGAATRAAIEGNVVNFAKALQAGGYGDPGKETYASELLARYKSLV